MKHVSTMDEGRRCGHCGFFGNFAPRDTVFFEEMTTERGVAVERTGSISHCAIESVLVQNDAAVQGVAAVQ